MGRIKLDLPPTFPFHTYIDVRITDLNYGGHVGNDTILSIIHEARVRLLHQKGFTELNIGNIGLIMSDVAIQFKSELFYGDKVKASVAATDFTTFSFEIYYLLEKEEDQKMITVAKAKTSMAGYNYESKKIASIPDTFRHKIAG
jgi:acyl-CoA thioesterase FadM